eukprot:TRINITY_DN11331_c0_g1_i1.p2 TRINITY_DN11331_c0_g1~~TRINITY_DN11331_c0_g1_i1.p2  ORF type:complete len:103 (+),score=19.71 TRINITY_DN11331_c0_g1_i1:181-489(+)
MCDTRKVNFNDANKSANKINNWVAKKTKNKIRRLFSKEKLGPNTVMILLNALYFKGKWDKPFDMANTKKRKFVVNKEKSINAKMMAQTEYFKVKDVKNLIQK